LPELPEVETYRRDLLKQFAGKILIQAHLGRERSSNISIAEFRELLSNKKLLDIRRFGKMLSFDFEGNISMLIHLMISGRYVISNVRVIPDRSTQIALWFENNKTVLIRYLFLGFCRLYTALELNRCDEIKKLGIDPMSAAFSLERFNVILDSRKSNIKSFLLNQKYLSGIGNIYADEILFQAGISPQRRINSLSRAEKALLHNAIIDRLRLGIETRGATIQNYADIYGNPGSFQDNIKVHSKMDADCVNCGHKIVRAKVGGRGTYYCPSCQK